MSNLLYVLIILCLTPEDIYLIIQDSVKDKAFISDNDNE